MVFGVQGVHTSQGSYTIWQNSKFVYSIIFVLSASVRNLSMNLIGEINLCLTLQLSLKTLATRLFNTHLYVWVGTCVG